MLICLQLWSAMARADDLAVANVDDLSFGSFAANDGGTITVVAYGAHGCAANGPTPLGIGCRAASFVVSGRPQSLYSISVMQSFATLTRQGGGSLTAGEFSFAPSGRAGQPWLLDLAGQQRVYVGATLTVPPHAIPGTYAGTFSVTVVYE